MAISERKKREKKQRRESIIDAAEMLFFKKGFDNVSMNDIAEEVELNRATIYLYFDNKEAVCFAVILRGIRILNKMIKKNVDRTNDMRKINAIGSTYYMFFQMYPQYYQVYNFFQSGKFDLDKLLNPKEDYHKNSIWDVKEIIKLQSEIFDILFDVVKNLKGIHISSDMDPKLFTIIIMSTLEDMINPSPVIKMKFNEIELNEYQNFNVIFISFLNRLLRLN